MIFAKTSDNKFRGFVDENGEEAISTIYYRYADSLFHYGLKFTSDTKIIEDCLQDLFLEIISKHRDLIFFENIRFYLFRSFRNNLLRLLSREKRFLKRPVEDVFNVLLRIEENTIGDDYSSDKIETLKAAMTNLSVRQREAVYLRFMNGLEYEEIAEIMDMEIESCRNTIYRAIKSLRKHFLSLFLLLQPLNSQCANCPRNGSVDV